NCAPAQSPGAARHHQASRPASARRIEQSCSATHREPQFHIDSIDGRLDAYHFSCRRPDPMICGRNVRAVPRSDVATGQSGRGKTHCDGACEVGHRDRCELRPLVGLRCLRWQGGRGMIVAFILLLVAVGSVLFHIYSPWWWTPIATNWSYIDHTI